MGKKTQLEDRQQAEALEPTHQPSDNIKPNHTMPFLLSFYLSPSFLHYVTCCLSFSKWGKKTLRDSGRKSEQKNNNMLAESKHAGREKSEQEKENFPVFLTKLRPRGADIKRSVRQTSPFNTPPAHSEGMQPLLIFHVPANWVRRFKLTGNFWCSSSARGIWPQKHRITCLLLDCVLHRWQHSSVTPCLPFLGED